MLSVVRQVLATVGSPPCVVCFPLCCPLGMWETTSTTEVFTPSCPLIYNFFYFFLTQVNMFLTSKTVGTKEKVAHNAVLVTYRCSSKVFFRKCFSLFKVQMLVFFLLTCSDQYQFLLWTTTVVFFSLLPSFLKKKKKHLSMNFCLVAPQIVHFTICKFLDCDGGKKKKIRKKKTLEKFSERQKEWSRTRSSTCSVDSDRKECVRADCSFLLWLQHFVILQTWCVSQRVGASRQISHPKHLTLS